MSEYKLVLCDMHGVAVAEFHDAQIESIVSELNEDGLLTLKTLEYNVLDCCGILSVDL
jgi:hypothetical protein